MAAAAPSRGCVAASSLRTRPLATGWAPGAFIRRTWALTHAAAVRSPMLPPRQRVPPSLRISPLRTARTGYVLVTTGISAVLPFFASIAGLIGAPAPTPHSPRAPARCLHPLIHLRHAPFSKRPTTTCSLFRRDQLLAYDCVRPDRDVHRDAGARCAGSRCASRHQLVHRRPRARRAGRFGV